MMRWIVAGLLLFWIAGATIADEIRPGYLQLNETSDDVFSVIWKVPAKGDKKLSLDVQLPENCKDNTRTNAQLLNGAYIQRWIVACKEGLVDTRREAQTIYYKLKSGEAGRIVEVLYELFCAPEGCST